MHPTQKIQQFVQAMKINIHASEADVQTQAAPILRKAVINYLREDKKGVLAKAFRGEYQFTDSDLRRDYGATYEEFLKKQGAKGAWGTYIEASAFAEMVGVNLVVTPVTKGEKQKPICLYKASHADAPTIHLYNSDNTHWYVNSNTQGDGDCLYNALIQAARTLIKKTTDSQTQSVGNGVVGFFPKDEISNDAIEHQKAIAEVVARHSTPDEVEQMMIAEQVRISKLSPQEQKQIASDYRMALQVAIEEFQNPHRQHIIVGAADSINKAVRVSC